MIMATISPVLAYFKWGFYGIGTSTGTAGAPGFVFFNNRSLTVLEGYYAELENFVFYANNVSSDETIQGAIYDSRLYLIASTAVTNVNGAKWYSMPITGQLVSGDYWLAIGMTEDIRYYYSTPVDTLQSNMTVGYELDNPAAIAPLGFASEFSMYIEYRILPLSADPGLEETLYTFSLFAVLAICLLLFKFGVPIVGLAFGVIALGLVAITIGSNYVIFSPYLQLGTAIVAIMLMLTSAKRGKNG